VTVDLLPVSSSAAGGVGAASALGGSGFADSAGGAAALGSAVGGASGLAGSGPEAAAPPHDATTTKQNGRNFIQVRDIVILRMCRLHAGSGVRT
jgi:hypothetical protein